MTKSDLIQKVMKKAASIDQKTAKVAVNTIFASLKDAIVRGERIEIRGFGNFTMRTYEPYSGRNPRTGGKVPVKSKKLPYFKAGKEIKERVDK